MVCEVPSPAEGTAKPSTGPVITFISPCQSNPGFLNATPTSTHLGWLAELPPSYLQAARCFLS